MKLEHGKPIKILFLIDQLQKGGTENQLIWLVENLPRDKFDPVLSVIRSNPYTDSLCLRTPVITLGKGSVLLLKNLLLIRKLFQVIQLNEFDILQTQFQESEIHGVLAALFCRKRPVIVSTRRNLYHWKSEKKVTFIVIKWLTRKVGYVLANSFAVKDKCHLLENVPCDKISVIQNAVDLSRFVSIDKDEVRKQFGLKTKDIVIGVVANWRPVKGLKVFLEAASLVSAQKMNVKFILVGSGPQENILREDIRKRGLKNVSLLDNTTDIPRIIATFDVAVQPSLSESFSNVLVEYMAAKKPVVATRVGDAELVIDQGINGLLIEPGDASKMANNILKLIEYPEEARSMAVRAQLKVRDLWEQTDILNNYQEFYLKSFRNK